MKRSIIDYLVISLKGMAMGAADVVPGVSGGTIAFISGIYEELIESLNNINSSIFNELKSSITPILPAKNTSSNSFLTDVFPFEKYEIFSF